MNAGRLNPKQERFCLEYLVDHNATQAATRAGYSPRTANEQAARLLANVSVRRRLAELSARQRERLDVQADDVLRELLRLGLSDIGQVLDFTGDELRLRPPRDIPEAARRAVASVKVRRFLEGKGEDAREVEVTEFKLWDKLSALDKLGKYLGLWKDALDLHLKGPPYKVYLGFSPEEALGQAPPPAPPTSPPDDGPTGPAAAPST